MKRKYQIAKQRGVHEFRQMAEHDNSSVQMMQPIADIASHLQHGGGHPMRQAGLELMNLVMAEEVKHLVGERHAQNKDRQAHRWGQEVPIQRQRVRDKENKQVWLGSYELFQRHGPMQAAVWDRMMRGLSARNYGAVAQQFTDAYGVKKSAVSENFVEASRAKLKELLERPLGDLRPCAVLIDGTPFRDRQIIVALGIGIDGKKTVLGLREGGTENTTVVSSLLSDRIERGMDFQCLRLYILDGGKALHRFGRKSARLASFSVAKCIRSATSLIRLTEEYKADVRRKMQNAYSMAGYDDAKRALNRLHRELMDINPSAARSLAEGLEETLTVHKLRVPEQLRRTMASTNVIESAFSIVETACRNVKRWHNGDQIERWLESGLLVAERQFRKVIGIKHIPAFLAALAKAAPPQPAVKTAAVA